MRFSQNAFGPRDAEQLGQLFSFGARKFTAGRAQVIKAAAFYAAPRVGALIKFLNEARSEQSLKGSIQSAGAQAHATVCLLLDMAHDCVSMEVFTRQSEQDVEGDCGQRIEFSSWHTVYRYIVKRAYIRQDGMSSAWVARLSQNVTSLAICFGFVGVLDA